MKKGRLLIIALLFAAMGAWLIWKAQHPPEPFYKGIPLSTCLVSAELGGEESQLEEALKEIGTNAIPTLLRSLEVRESPFADELFHWLLRRKVYIRHIPVSQLKSRVVRAFYFLGPKASNAVPALIQIYHRDNSLTTKGAVLRSLGCIGPAASPAIPILLRETTNSNTTIRANALYALGKIQAQPGLVVPVLTSALSNVEIILRFAAASSLARFGPDAGSSAPALIELLKDPDSHVRLRAIETLDAIQAPPALLIPALEASLHDLQFEARMEAAEVLVNRGHAGPLVVPVLLELTTNSDQRLRIQATNLLKQIDTQAASPERRIPNGLNTEDKR
jgi:HEAT repeat protein